MKFSSLIAALCMTSMISGCATLTGIPGHGGGKRFSEEQRLVSSAIRMSVRHIDVSQLKGKDVAIIFGLIADEGGGNIVGGRASITAVMTQGVVTVPMSQTRNGVDIFQIATGSNSSTNTSSSGSSTNTSSGTSGQSTEGSTSSTSNTTSNGQNSSTTNGSTTSTTNGTNASTTSGTSTAATTSEISTDANQTTVTTSTSQTDGTSTNAATGTSVSTVTGTNSSTSAVTNAGTNTTTVTGTNSGTNSGTTTNSGTEAVTSTGTSEQAIVTNSETTGSGRQTESNIGITYEGLGQYQNLAVPKSDAAFLMSEVRNHLLLNGIQVRSPADPAAEAFIYVSVPILGTNRSRTDLLLYNKESLSAEAYIEMFAIDRTGRVVMQPQTGNFETFYHEDYIAWSGPYNTRRGAEEGIGLIGDLGEVHDTLFDE